MDFMDFTTKKTYFSLGFLELHVMMWTALN